MGSTNENLMMRYNTIMGKVRPWDFFMALRDYIDYALTAPLLKSVFDHEFAIRNEKYDQIGQLERKSLEEMEDAKKKLLGIIEKYKIDVTSFTSFTSFIPLPEIKGQPAETIITRMEAFEKGNILMSGFRSDNLQRFLFDIASNLKTLGYQDEMEEFSLTRGEYQSYYARINGEPDQSGLFIYSNTRGHFTFSKTWPERFEKVRAVKREQELEPWGAFECVLKFWQASRYLAMGLNPMMGVWAELEYSFKEDAEADVFRATSDLEILLKNHNAHDAELSFLDTDDFKNYMIVVNSKLMQTLPENNTPEAKIKSKAKTNALHKKIEEARTDYIDSMLEKMEVFMEEYRSDKEDRMKQEQEVLGGKWWKIGERPTFNKENGRITLDGKTCQIPMDAINQMVVCEGVFSEQFGSWMFEDKIIRFLLKGEDSKRAVSDATRAINKTVADSDLKISKLLQYSGRSRRVRIASELFDEK